jgi:hypothetical protein
MTTFSIYTAIYNLENSFIDWRGAIDNFLDFAEEVSICTLKKDIDILYKYLSDHIKAKKIKISICEDNILETMDFDGVMKNKALKKCTQKFCILLDGDERVNKKDKSRWKKAAESLSNSEYDAFLIPVIDLYNTSSEYKSIGMKWYLAKNLTNLNRGIVGFAKNGNKIDISKSDTTELIYNDGMLVRSVPIHRDGLTINAVKELGIKVWHLGWLDKEKRLKANAFWQSVWNNRAGREVTDIIHTKDKLDKIEYWPHGLRLWDE